MGAPACVRACPFSAGLSGFSRILVTSRPLLMSHSGKFDPERRKWMKECSGRFCSLSLETATTFKESKVVCSLLTPKKVSPSPNFSERITRKEPFVPGRTRTPRRRFYLQSSL